MNEPMIPGGFEKRPPRASTRPPPGIPIVVSIPVQPAAAIPDRDQLEHEREGGGAPSQRKVKMKRP
jgi:hypothetical protein